MWPALVFGLLVLVVVADSLWKERRLRRQRLLAKQEYTGQLLRQQQEAYAHAQAQQRALFDSMADGVVLLGGDGRIELVNNSLRKLFKLEAKEGQGQSLLKALQVPVLSDITERLQTKDVVLGLETDLATTPARHVEINASAIRDRTGEYRGAILVFHDLSRVKQLERTRKEFVANVSHELRTPLSLINGFVETLLEGAKDDPAVATRYLKTIQKHTHRLTYLIEDLLSISQLESGQVILSFTPVLVREVAQRVIEDLRAKAVEKRMDVVNEISGKFIVRADGNRLEQVLFNLVENAIKYGRIDGHVWIGSDQRDQDLEISVRDDGPGIPEEAQGRIFERFYRVDRARSRDTGGTGLGLAIVKHIVLAHGGNVWVESQIGLGSTFRFTLPTSRLLENDDFSLEPLQINSASERPLDGGDRTVPPPRSDFGAK